MMFEFLHHLELIRFAIVFPGGVAAISLFLISMPLTVILWRVAFMKWPRFGQSIGPASSPP
jgi:hypothetical protein